MTFKTLTSPRCCLTERGFLCLVQAKVLVYFGPSSDKYTGREDLGYIDTDPDKKCFVDTRVFKTKYILVVL